jgi:hypothetical protein
VPELVIQEGPPSTLRNVDDRPSEVSELEIQEHPLSTLRNVNGGPREVPELKIWERSACGAHPSGRTVNSYRNLGINA